MEYIKVNLPRTKEDFEVGNGEGCWVLVSEEIKEKYDMRHDGGLFEGILDNDSYYYPDLKCGAKVLFTMRGNYRPVAFINGFLEYYYVLTDEEFNQLNNRLNFKNKMVIISKRAYRDKKIGFLFRDYTGHENDTGWIIMSGSETDEEQADSEQFMVVAMKSVLEIDKRIGLFMHTEPRCVFCLNSDNEFELVYDFDWEAYDNDF